MVWFTQDILIIERTGAAGSVGIGEHIPAFRISNLAFRGQGEG
jgi:hypothetical protein